MLEAALENYIKLAASSNNHGPSNVASSKTSPGNLESLSEVVDCFLWTVAAIIGQVSYNEFQHQMQDGLIELVIAYQVIHRLRDLFALYDRPQVEGSPFPSSILLGINLLTVLTSKFKGCSSIDWVSFPTDVEQGNKVKESAESRCISDESIVDGSLSTDIADISEHRTLDEPSDNGKGVPIIICDNSHDDEHIAKRHMVNVSNESLGAQPEDKYTCSVNQKVKNNCSANGAHLKQPAAFLLSAMSETGLVSLPSMLTAVLLQANNRLSAEQVHTFLLHSIC